MKLKTFAILLGILCILSVAVYYTSYSGKPSTRSSDMGARLFPELAAGDVAAISVVSPEDNTTIKQAQSGWTVAERFDYPADFSKIAELVKKLTGAKIGRSFAASDESRARLSLYLPDKKDVPAEQRGVRIVLTDKNKKTLADLLVGKEREGGGDTAYVMPQPEGRICLVNQDFRYIEKKPAGWLNKKPIDLDPKKIERVVLFDPAKTRARYTLKRPAAGKDPVLLDLPAGKKLAKYKVDQLFEALTSLSIDDVEDPGQKDPGRFKDALRFDYFLYDGTVYHVFPGAATRDSSDKHYFRAAVEFLPPAGLNEPEKKADNEKLAAAAESLNRKLGAWTYVVSKWVYDSFITDPEGFVEKEAKK